MLYQKKKINTYNDMYNDMPTEEFVAWINKKYEEYSNIINKLNEVPN